MSPTVSGRASSALLATPWLGLLAGGLCWWWGAGDAARWAWAATALLVLAPTVVATGARLWRGETGVDLIAALAMASAVILGEELAAAIVACMLSSGTALEAYAQGLAHRELEALLARAPRAAHRLEGPRVVDVDTEQVNVGDLLLVKGGEVVPVDGLLASPTAVLDASALTGEARPVRVSRGGAVRSGVANAGAPFELRATAVAAQSTYAGIVRLVTQAEASRAPFAREADRYALWFLLVTLLLAGAAWAVSGDAVRALAVVVVATPCPLILAVPAALVSGLSCAARRGVIFKGGAALEALARAQVLLLDKTGTITSGRPRLVRTEPLALGADEVLRLAGSLEQLSVHPFAPAIVEAAQARGLELSFPLKAREEPGLGIEGQVDGRRLALGQLEWVAPGASSPALRRALRRSEVEGTAAVLLALDGEPAGALILEDPIRPEAPRVLQRVRRAGIERVLMVSGDRPDVAEMVSDAVGIDRVFSQRSPAEKVDVVHEARNEGRTVMVGDGLNDAPALAAADVGVAMGARGAAAAAEAADVVLTGDRLEGLVQALLVARRTRGIAVQSALAGMSLSGVAMLAAAAGQLTPVLGAVLQEGIDLLVILNALRALRAPRWEPARLPGHARLAERLHRAHDELRPGLDDIAALAAGLRELSPAEALARLGRARDYLQDELLPHERQEQQEAFAALKQLLPDEDPTALLTRTHGEIARLSRLLARVVERLPAGGPEPEDQSDLERLLYGLHAILTLHFAQEDELYGLLDGAVEPAPAPAAR